MPSIAILCNFQISHTKRDRCWSTLVVVEISGASELHYDYLCCSESLRYTRILSDSARDMSLYIVIFPVHERQANS